MQYSFGSKIFQINFLLSVLKLLLKQVFRQIAFFEQAGLTLVGPERLHDNVDLFQTLYLFYLALVVFHQELLLLQLAFVRY